MDVGNFRAMMLGGFLKRDDILCPIISCGNRDGQKKITIFLVDYTPMDFVGLCGKKHTDGFTFPGINSYTGPPTFADAVQDARTHSFSNRDGHTNPNSYSLPYYHTNPHRNYRSRN
jgi:hypothetical protein